MTMQCLPLFACFNHGATGVGQCLYLRFLRCYFGPVPFFTPCMFHDALYLSLVCLGPLDLDSSKEEEAKRKVTRTKVAYGFERHLRISFVFFNVVIYEILEELVFKGDSIAVQYRNISNDGTGYSLRYAIRL